LGLVLKVFEPPGGAGSGEFEGLVFIEGLAADEHRPDDAGQFVGGGDNALGFSKPAFEAAHVITHAAFGAA
jgi:hypothetical protein